MYRSAIIRSVVALCLIPAIVGCGEVYYPDQEAFSGSVAVGNGLRSLEHISGDQGRQNTVVGVGAGLSLTSGKYNTLIGANSGRDMTADDVPTTYSPYARIGNHGNTFVGRNTAIVANGALDNTGIGVNVMLNLTTGMDNFAGGINALRDVQAGSENVAMGHGSLQHLIGKGTFEVGDGHRNTALGDMAGRFLAGYEDEKTGGSTSVYVGARTTSQSSAAVNENAFGYEAAGRGSNTISYGNGEIAEHYFKSGPIFTPGHGLTSKAPNAYIDPFTGEVKRSDVALGELVRAVASVDSAIGLSTGQPISILSIELGPGVWDVSGVGVFDGDPSTIVRYLAVGISKQGGALPSEFDTASQHGFDSAMFSVNSARVVAPTRRITLTTKTTIHIVTEAYFADGGSTAYGRIEARRAG